MTTAFFRPNHLLCCFVIELFSGVLRCHIWDYLNAVLNDAMLVWSMIGHRSLTSPQGRSIPRGPLHCILTTQVGELAFLL